MPSNPATRRPSLSRASGLAFAGLVLLFACQDPAGVPRMLEPGVVSFVASGQLEDTITADGRCYWAPGYPAADSACSVAIDLGDTLRIRAVRFPRTIKWQHINLEFPEDGSCTGPEACRIAMDFLTRVGVVEQSYRSTEAAVTILEATDDRLRGTFGGLLYRSGGRSGDTIRVTGGVFDVPLER